MKIYEITHANNQKTIVVANGLIAVSNAYQEANKIELLHGKCVSLKYDSELINALILINEKIDAYWNAAPDDRGNHEIGITRAQKHCLELIDKFQKP